MFDICMKRKIEQSKASGINFPAKSDDDVEKDKQEHELYA